MNFLGSNSDLLMKKSMEYLWAKQAAILDNIANAETPNYKPKVVTFEQNLKALLEEAQDDKVSVREIREILGSSSFYTEEQMESTRLDDNGVNITEQSAEMIRNAYQLQYTMSAISSDLERLRTAVRGQ